MKRLILCMALLAMASTGLASTTIVAVEEIEFPVEAFWAAMSTNYDGSRIAANFQGQIYYWEDGVWTYVSEGHPLTSSVGISADGTAIISAKDDPDTGLRNPTIWYEAEGWMPTMLGGIEGSGGCDNSLGSGYALNHDGSLAIGLGWMNCDALAFMWSVESGMVDIGGIRASNISDEGNMVVGFDHHPEWGGRRATYWMNDVSMIPPAGVDGPHLIGEPNDAPSECYDTTSDGGVIVGEMFPEGAPLFFSQAMRYTEETGYVMLGTLGDNENHRSIATLVSNDGKVCGVSGDPPPWGMWDVFVWTAENGMEQLKQMCLDSGVDLPDGFENLFFIGASALSSDGSTMIVTWQDDMWNQGSFKITFEGSVAVEEPGDQAGDTLPSAVSLAQNFPNPFNPSTTIKFTLPSTENVKLSIYDVKGRMVRTLVNGSEVAGNHSVIWDGKDSAGSSVSSGTYMYRLITETRTYTRTMSLLK